MLAPRKKLWSTPVEVLEKAISLLDLRENDVVYDIGAGNGNFIITCGLSHPSIQCIGVEIDEERGNSANQAIEAAGLSLNRCQVIVGNALEIDYSNATAFYLYLVPRGLRIIQSILKSLTQKNIRVLTYMSPLPEGKPISIHKVSTASHPEAEWPLYYYILNPDPDTP